MRDSPVPHVRMGGHLIGRGALWAVTGRGREIVGGGCGLTWWDARTGASSRSVGGVQVRGPALAWHPNANKVSSPLFSHAQRKYLIPNSTLLLSYTFAYTTKKFQHLYST